MDPSTHLEALQAELLGDVGRLHDEVKDLRVMLPELTRSFAEAAENAKLAVGAVTGAALEALRGVPQAQMMPGVASIMSLVRDHLEQLVARLDALPQQAVAEAIAPGVTTTIDNVRRALEVIRREVEAVLDRSEQGIVQLTESGLSACSAAKAGMDASVQQVSALLAELRRAVGTVERAGVEAAKASSAAAAMAARQYEAAAAEMLAATKSARRSTAAVAILAVLVTVSAWAWREVVGGGSSALARWATSPTGRAAYAFTKANPRGVALLTACDLPTWHRVTVHGRPACEVATTKDGRPFGWYLPEVRQ